MTLTLTFPNDVAFYAAQADLDKFSRTLAGPDWFAFQPAKEVVPGVIDMDRWLDGPAGKHGGVRMVKDGFAFEDGTPVKFWGVNLSYTANAPDHETADFTAARFAKYGVNAVRMHKFSYPTGQMGIGDPNDSTRMDPKGLDRLDYFASKLKEHGVYFGWSHTYGFHVVPGDRKRLLAYDEIAKNLKGNTYAFIHFAEDVQDLMIEMVVNLLKHKNPYTGRTYAEEPALCFIELQNEDDIFFYTSRERVQRLPDLQEAVPGAVRGLAEGALRFAGETAGGLGRCPAPGRDAGGRQHRAAAEPVVLRRGSPAGPEGRSAAAAARHGRLPARRAGSVL